MNDAQNMRRRQYYLYVWFSKPVPLEGSWEACVIPYDLEMFFLNSTCSPESFIKTEKKCMMNKTEYLPFSLGKDQLDRVSKVGRLGQMCTHITPTNRELVMVLFNRKP